MKTLAEVEQSSASLVKAMSESMEQVGAQPMPAKGIPSSAAVLNKSFGGGAESPKVDMGKLSQVLLKSVQDGKLSMGVVTKFEAGRDLSVIPQEILSQAMVGVEE